MNDIVTTILTLVLFAAAAASSGLGFWLLKPRDTPPSPAVRTWHLALIGFCIVGCGFVFVYRQVWVYSNWEPLEAHVDGLMLITALFAAAVLFIQRTGMRGISVFAAPVMAFLMAWAICAGIWTFQSFNIDSVWLLVHRIGVYVGTVAVFVAAAAGVMYLLVQRRLRQHQRPQSTRPLASLEAIETTIIRAAAIGFALITIGMVTGFIIVSTGPTALGPHWWFTPKFILSTVVWAIFALVMSVRRATYFRGARAAWLSIAGVLLLFATLGIAATGEQVPQVAPPTDARQAEVP